MNKSTKETIPIIGAPTPDRPSLARQTHDYIEAKIKDLLASTKEGLDALSKAARVLHLLPLDPANGERWYGLRPDGDLLLFNLQEPYGEKEEEDRWQRTAVLLKASKKYPALQPLVPPPPLSRSICSQCGGTGTIKHRGEQSECVCQGVGWWPAIVDEIEEEQNEEPKQNDQAIK